MIANELIREVEAIGGSLSLRGDRIHYELPTGTVAILEKLKAHRDEVVAELRRRYPVIPAGAFLIAPRFDGAGKPLTRTPSCWCCKKPWKLDQLEESKDKTKLYAVLGPACGCLDAPQALACCGLCVEHCRCSHRAGARREREEMAARVLPDVQAVCWHCQGTGKCNCSTCWPGGKCVPCMVPTTNASAQKISQGDFRTPQGDGDSR